MSREHITVVKIGGNVVDNPEALSRFIENFVKLGGRKILVHGGGKEATRLSGALGIETVMIDGRRVTDRQTLDVVTMVYAGLVNKRIVAMLQEAGCNAIGLSGADGNAIKAVRRQANPVDYGFVGDINPADVNTDLIVSMIDSGLCPVFCAITHDGNGTLLNCNADSVASALAVAISKSNTVDLIYCFEKKGVLTDVDNPSSVISNINRDSYTKLLDIGIISKGMMPKLVNALAAVDFGVNSVTIKHADDLIKNAGTTISL